MLFGLRAPKAPSSVLKARARGVMVVAAAAAVDGPMAPGEPGGLGYRSISNAHFLSSKVETGEGASSREMERSERWLAVGMALKMDHAR